MILRKLYGIRVPFIKNVKQTRIPHQIKMKASEEAVVDAKIAELLRDKCIVQNKGFIKGGWVHYIFLVKKRDSTKHRMIINCKELNKFVKKTHFKTESIRDVLRLVPKYGYMSVLDIENAYGHLRLVKDQHFLYQFTWKQKWYSFVTLPQGNSSSPYEFTTICRSIAGYLREKGVFMVIYFDDIIVIGKDFKTCQYNLDLVVETLNNCGFILNMKKSHLTPCQRVDILGFTIDSRTQTIELTIDKRLKLKSIFQSASQSTSVMIREFAKWVGLIVSIFIVFPYGQMYYRNLEHSKLRALRQNKFKSNKQLILSHRDRETLTWWLRTVTVNKPHCFEVTAPSAVLSTDSSLRGWGSHLAGVGSTGSRFDHDDSKHSINTLELLAVKYGLLSFQKHLKDKHILLKSDSVNTLSDLHKWGSMCSNFRENTVKFIHEFLAQLNSTISLQWIQSSDNIISDRRSRIFYSEMTEWHIQHVKTSRA